MVGLVGFDTYTIRSEFGLRLILQRGLLPRATTASFVTIGQLTPRIILIRCGYLSPQARKKLVRDNAPGRGAFDDLAQGQCFYFKPIAHTTVGPAFNVISVLHEQHVAVRFTSGLYPQAA